MANSSSLAYVNSLTTPTKLRNHPRVLLPKAHVRSGNPSRVHLLKAKNADSNPGTKTSSILRAECVGNGIEALSSNLNRQSMFRTFLYTKIPTSRGTSSKSGCCSATAFMGVGRKAKKTAIVIPEPDYRIPLVLLGIAGGFVYQDNLLPAAAVGLLGLLLLFQTTRVRFVFDKEALEVKVGDELQESEENVFVGGKNRWKYSTFLNWELWWPNFPILVYFKETQTRPEGQVHFFPVIFNGKQLYDVMVERAGPSKTSSPK